MVVDIMRYSWANEAWLRSEPVPEPLQPIPDLFYTSSRKGRGGGGVESIIDFRK